MALIGLAVDDAELESLLQHPFIFGALPTYMLQIHVSFAG